MASDTADTTVKKPAEVKHDDAKDTSLDTKDTHAWHPACDQTQLDTIRQATSATADKTQTLEQAGTIPVCRLETPLQTIVPQNDRDRSYVAAYQDRMMSASTMAAITKDDKGNPADAATVQKRIEAIQKEREQGVWGPESQMAFRDYLHTLQSDMIPGRASLHATYGIPMPPDFPVKMPVGADGKVMSLEEYQAKLAKGELTVDLGIKPDHIPTPAEVKTLERAVSWMTDSQVAVDKQNTAWRDQYFNKMIDDGVLPESFRFNPGVPKDDPRYSQLQDQWRDNMQNMDAMRQTLVRNLDSMKFLEEQAQKGTMAEISELVQKGIGTYDPMNKNLTLFRALGLPDGVKVKYDDRGQVAGVEFPKDLKPGDPRWDSWRQWLDRSTDQIHAALDVEHLTKKNPNMAVGWGDLELPYSTDKATGDKVPMLAALDSHGKLVQLFDQSQQEKDPAAVKPTVLSGADADKARQDMKTTALGGPATEVDLEKLTDPKAIRDAIADGLKRAHAGENIYFHVDAKATVPVLDDQGHPVQKKDAQGQPVTKDGKPVYATISQSELLFQALKADDPSTFSVFKKSDGQKADPDGGTPLAGRIQLAKNVGVLTELGDGNVASSAGKYVFSDEQYTGRDANLLEMRPTATAANPGDPNSDIVVSYHTRAQWVPPYGYQNAFAQNVGDEMDLQQRHYKPDDMVAISEGGETKLLRARELPDYLSTQAAWHYGTKAVIGALDASMVIGTVFTAGTAGYAAFGARMAVRTAVKEATEQAVEQTARTGLADAAKYTAWDGLHKVGQTGAALTFWANNAYWHGEVPQIDQMRGYFFLGAGTGMLIPGKLLPGSLRSAKNLFTGEGASAFEQGAAGNMPAMLRVANEGANWTMQVTQPAMALMIASGLKAQIEAKMKPGYKADQLAEAGLGPGKNVPDVTGAIAPPNKLDLPASATELEMLKATYQNNPETKDKYTKIFDHWGTLLDPKADEQSKRAAASALAANLTFTGEQLKELEKANGGTLTADQIHDLMDPQKRALYPSKDVRDMANGYLSARDSEAVRLSEMALLSTHDPNASGDLSGTSVTVPLYSRRNPQPHTRQVNILIPSHDVALGISTAGVINDLKSRMADQSSAKENVIAAGMLARLGAMPTQDFAGLVTKALKDGSLKPEEKMALLSSSYGMMTATLITQEHDRELKIGKLDKDDPQKNFEIGQTYTNTAQDRMNELADVAAHDPDARVRAMAAGTLYGLSRLFSSANPTPQVLEGLQKSWQADGGTSADKAMSVVKDELIKGLSTPLPPGNGADRDAAIQQRMEAAKVLAIIAPNLPDNADLQSKINSSLVQAFNSIGTTGKDELQKAMLMLNSLPGDRLKQMSADDSYVGHLLAMVPAPRSDLSQGQYADFLRKLPQAVGDNTQAKAQLTSLLSQYLTNPPGSSPDYNYPKLRAAAIDAAVSLGSRQLLPTIESLAQNDASPIVREAALKALDTMNDDNLKTIVSSRSPLETDPTVADRLNTLRVKLFKENDPALNAQLDRVRQAAEIASRYPQVNADADAMRKFLTQNAGTQYDMSLLEHDLFVEAAKKEAQDKLNDKSPAAIMDSLVKQRDAQFQLLMNMAQDIPHGQFNESQQLMARKFLYDVIMQNGKPITDGSGSIMLGTVDKTEYDVATSYTRKQGVFFNESREQWEQQAADAITAAMKNTHLGTDFDAYMVSSLLLNQSSLSPESRQKLLQVWQQLGDPQQDTGRNTISAERYRDVLGQALKAEQQRRLSGGFFDNQRYIPTDYEGELKRLLGPDGDKHRVKTPERPSFWQQVMQSSQFIAP